jgi:hypothetical protein
MHKTYTIIRVKYVCSNRNVCLPEVGTSDRSSDMPIVSNKEKCIKISD